MSSPFERLDLHRQWNPAHDDLPRLPHDVGGAAQDGVDASGAGAVGLEQLGRGLGRGEAAGRAWVGLSIGSTLSERDGTAALRQACGRNSAPPRS